MHRLRRSLAAIGTLGVCTVAACAGRQEPQEQPAEQESHGLLTTGFETTLFRPCDDSAANSGPAIGLSRAVADVVGETWPPGAEVQDRFGQTYYVYDIRAIIRPRPEPPPAPAGHMRISSAPRRDISRIIELRAARPGTCGFDPEWHLRRAP
jgi:hypothetical protein